LTQGGFTHVEVDRAGYAMFDSFVAEVQRQAGTLKTGELSITCVASQQSGRVDNPTYRVPVAAGPRFAEVRLFTSPPAQSELLRRITLEVPKDSGKEDDLVLRCYETGEIFQSRITEAHPVVTGTLQLRIAVFVHGLLGRAIADIAKSAASVLRQQGY
jgi:hypothetical protein